MTSAQTKVPRGQAAARRGHPQRLRPMALGLLNLLLVQYALGMVVNLYVRVPSDHAGYGAAAPALVLHAVAGITVVAGSISLAARSVAARARQIVAPGIIAAVALVTAATGGVTFLRTGVSGASLAMALCTAIAISCYGLILYRYSKPDDPGH